MVETSNDSSEESRFSSSSQHSVENKRDSPQMAHPASYTQQVVQECLTVVRSRSSIPQTFILFIIILCVCVHMVCVGVGYAEAMMHL